MGRQEKNQLANQGQGRSCWGVGGAEVISGQCDRCRCHDPLCGESRILQDCARDARHAWCIWCQCSATDAFGLFAEAYIRKRGEWDSSTNTPGMSCTTATRPGICVCVQVLMVWPQVMAMGLNPSALPLKLAESDEVNFGDMSLGSQAVIALAGYLEKLCHQNNRGSRYFPNPPVLSLFCSLLLSLLLSASHPPSSVYFLSASLLLCCWYHCTLLSTSSLHFVGYSSC